MGTQPCHHRSLAHCPSRCAHTHTCTGCRFCHLASGYCLSFGWTRRPAAVTMAPIGCISSSLCGGAHWLAPICRSPQLDVQAFPFLAARGAHRDVEPQPAVARTANSKAPERISGRALRGLRSRSARTRSSRWHGRCSLTVCARLPDSANGFTPLAVGPSRVALSGPPPLPSTMSCVHGPLHILANTCPVSGGMFALWFDT